MAKVKDGKWSVTSSALWELDILLKNSRISNEERFDVFNALASEFPVLVGTRLCVSPNQCSCYAYYRHYRSYLYQRVGKTTYSLDRGSAVEWVDGAAVRTTEAASRSDKAKSATTRAIVQSENLIC